MCTEFTGDAGAHPVVLLTARIHILALVSPEKARANAERYYGEVLGNNGDLRTDACCCADAFPATHREILKEIEPEILEKFYGCGSPIPPALEGCTVLDLGCGAGRDAYLVSKLVGPGGQVIGVDITAEQLAVAQKHLGAQMKRFGYVVPNVTFHRGPIEDLGSLGLVDNSIDVVISNCVINLSASKERVFSEIFRVLKPGGELLFSDVFADRRLPEALMHDPVLHGECLGGALYYEDFRRLLQRLGCRDLRQVSSSAISIEDKETAAKIGPANFRSITVRAFKLSALEDRCEDYGQAVTYRGTLSEHPDAFVLDDHHEFPTGKAVAVCGNTAAMLEETRYSEYFTVHGDRSTHLGLFDCAQPGSGSSTDPSTGMCC